MNLKFVFHAVIIICIFTLISAISAATIATAVSQTNTTSVQEDEIYKKGADLYNLGKYQEAIGFFDKVLAVNPNDAKTLTDKGVFLVALQKI